MNRLPRSIPALTLALALCAPASANFIVGADHPAFGDKGFALQSDNRLFYQYSDTFVNADGSTRYAMARSRQGQFMFRWFIPGWMLRLSTAYSHNQANDKSRMGWGDTTMEVGASREFGDWRVRALVAVKAPTGDFDKNQTVNIGSGQWDIGPAFYLTRYLFSKSLDLNLYSLYYHRMPNTESGLRPGAQFSYALEASWLFKIPFAPTRLGIEQRGLLNDPNRRDGRAVSAATRQFSVGPVAQINLSKLIPGFTVWPTVQFDFHDRNFAKTRMCYLRLTYNY